MAGKIRPRTSYNLRHRKTINYLKQVSVSAIVREVIALSFEGEEMGSLKAEKALKRITKDPKLKPYLKQRVKVEDDSLKISINKISADELEKKTPMVKPVGIEKNVINCFCKSHNILNQDIRFQKRRIYSDIRLQLYYVLKDICGIKYGRIGLLLSKNSSTMYTGIQNHHDLVGTANQEYTQKYVDALVMLLEHDMKPDILENIKYELSRPKFKSFLHKYRDKLKDITNEEAN